MSDFLDSDVDDEDEDEQSEEDESKEKDDAASKDKDSEESTEKRISALQSKADKMEARANKAEKALKAKTKTARDGEKTEAMPAEVKEWLESARSGLRDDLYGADERFKGFDLDSSLITGDTPAEMRESQKALTEFVDKMEGQIRNAVLVEHGFKPEPKTSQRSEPVNYKSMSKEEFAKVEAEILGSGELRRS